MSDFQTRLKQLIDHRFDGKWTHFARDAALSQGSVNNYLRGSTTPGYKQITQICEVSHVNANWLILGEGPMFRDEPHSESPQGEVAQEQPPSQNWWQDLARTLQLRINQLEAEVRELQEAADHKKEASESGNHPTSGTPSANGLEENPDEG